MREDHEGPRPPFQPAARSKSPAHQQAVHMQQLRRLCERRGRRLLCGRQHVIRQQGADAERVQSQVLRGGAVWARVSGVGTAAAWEYHDDRHIWRGLADWPRVRTPGAEQVCSTRCRWPSDRACAPAAQQPKADSAAKRLRLAATTPFSRTIAALASGVRSASQPSSSASARVVCSSCTASCTCDSVIWVGRHGRLRWRQAADGSQTMAKHVHVPTARGPPRSHLVLDALRHTD